MTSTGRVVARAAAGIAIVTVAARVMGFLRIAVFSRAVGATSLGNTYQTANTLPNVVFEIVAGGALASLVVPLIAGPIERGDRAEAGQTTAALLTWTVAILTPVALLGVLLGRPLMWLLTAGVDDPALRQAEVDAGARMLVVFMPQVVLYGVGIVLAGVLQAHRRFLAPALAPLLSSVVVIGAYLAFAAVAGRAPGLDEVSRGEELLLSLGTTAGVAALSLPLFVPLARLGLPLRPTLRMPAGVAARVRRLALAGVAAVAAQQLAQLVALFLTNAQPGAVVVYTIAYTVFLLPWAVLAVPLATSVFPSLAAAYDGGDEPSYARTVAGALRATVIVMTGAAAVLAGAAGPVARIVAGVQHAPTDTVGRAIAAFAPGLVGYGVLALLTRALYARHRARDAAVATVAGFAVTAVAGIGFVVLAAAGFGGLDVSRDRVAALGAAHSVGMTVAGLLLARAVRRAAGDDATRGAARTAALAGVAGAAGAVAGALAVRLAGDAPDVVSALAGGLMAVLAWAGVVLAARLPEARAAVGWLKERRG